jgi:hypothetical protein
VSEIVERAAKAVCVRLPGVSASDCLQGQSHRTPCDATNCLAVEIADAALLAALDPEDEAMVERVAADVWHAYADDPLQVGKFKEPTDYRSYRDLTEEQKQAPRRYARAAISALRAMVLPNDR